MLTITDDHSVVRIKERKALSQILWFANLSQPLDVDSVFARLKVLPPRARYVFGSGFRALPKGGNVRVGERERSATIALHAWLRAFLERHVETRASRMRMRKMAVANRLKSVWLAEGDMSLMLKGSDVFARVVFDGRRWLIVGEQFYIPQLEGLIHYAASLLCDVDREWHRSLFRCRHKLKGKNPCGRYFLKRPVGASPERCPPHQRARDRTTQKRRNWNRKVRSYYGA